MGVVVVSARNLKLCFCQFTMSSWDKLWNRSRFTFVRGLFYRFVVVFFGWLLDFKFYGRML
jgi:hypothetical protein